MSKLQIGIVILILGIAGYFAATFVRNKQPDPQGINVSPSESKTYYTCPMHPQIHQDHEGECPICHMKLVKVTKTTKSTGSGEQLGDKRSVLEISNNQLELIGIQKTEVERMSLTAKIPISGRFISSTSVAFQIYEEDLGQMRTGLRFNGQSSSTSEDAVSGVIVSVDSIVDPSSRTVRVIGSIKSGAKNVRPETSFSGEILIDLKDRLGIPESSVLRTGSRDIVYVFGEDNKLTAKTVKVGLKTEGFFEVVSGLKEGDVISSGPNFLIDSEAKIRGAND